MDIPQQKSVSDLTVADFQESNEGHYVGFYIAIPDTLEYVDGDISDNDAKQTRADAIRSDKKLMADVAAHAKAQVNTLTKVVGVAATSKPAVKPVAKAKAKPAAVKKV